MSKIVVVRTVIEIIGPSYKKWPLEDLLELVLGD